MDSELPHCTVCLKPLRAGWLCAEHSRTSDFETHPVGTASRIAALEAIVAFVALIPAAPTPSR